MEEKHTGEKAEKEESNWTCPGEGSETQVQHIRAGQVKIAGGKLKRGTHKGGDKSHCKNLCIYILSQDL